LPFVSVTPDDGVLESWLIQAMPIFPCVLFEAKAQGKFPPEPETP
jgi:hypothetical protein